MNLCKGRKFKNFFLKEGILRNKILSNFHASNVSFDSKFRSFVYLIPVETFFDSKLG